MSPEWVMVVFATTGAIASVVVFVRNSGINAERHANNLKKLEELTLKIQELAVQFSKMEIERRLNDLEDLAWSNAGVCHWINNALHQMPVIMGLDGSKTREWENCVDRLRARARESMEERRGKR